MLGFSRSRHDAGTQIQRRRLQSDPAAELVINI